MASHSNPSTAIDAVAGVTAAAPPADDTTTERLWRLIGKLQVAMLSTRSADGLLRARPLATQNLADDRGSLLWFFVRADSEAADDVAADARIGIIYADPRDDSYVSVSGHAVVQRDPARQAALWTPQAARWFAEGPDDAQLRLLEVQMHSAEYWDVQASKMVQLWKLAKAAVTGQPPQALGEHQVLTLPLASRD